MTRGSGDAQVGPARVLSSHAFKGITSGGMENFTMDESSETDLMVDSQHLAKNYLDLYILDEAPFVSVSNYRTLKHAYHEILAQGNFRESKFHLLSGSKITGSACATSDKRLFGVWVYLFHGSYAVHRFYKMVNSHENRTRIEPSFCAASKFIPVENQCDIASKNRTSFQWDVSSTGDYTVVYYLPARGVLGRTVSLEVDLDITITTYAPTAFREPVCKHVINCTVPPAEHLILDMAHHQGQILTPAYALVVVSACRPKVVIYVCIFGACPFFILAVSTILFIKLRRRQDSFMGKFNYAQIYGINYGSVSSSQSIRAVPPVLERTSSSTYNV